MYHIIVAPILGPENSLQLSQGFVNPFPSFKWCAFAAESSGTAPSVEGGLIEHAYSAAAVMLADIVRAAVCF